MPERIRRYHLFQYQGPDKFLCEPIGDEPNPRAKRPASKTPEVPQAPRNYLSDIDIVGVISESLYSRAKDPTSLRFMELGTIDREHWCVVYSATNSFNARVRDVLYYNARTGMTSADAMEFSRRCRTGQTLMKTTPI